ncbi:CarD family transcriptional regulator [Virgibacillus phasianinus]|uniref:CarD family transcriptional regulator n=1 Tax=Virgibacillus phasianinus TaxID=2017483 RepID=A0A220U6V3_9BACI|nr:CarD family transcriptional regulator [Virgibacillus phasianinus]ASK63878.1 CarD family transcriptional regulator [Virgibacillus phasianinus]
MFQIGDLIIYSAHGICRIDDICEKTVSGITRQYYVLHPEADQHQLTISTPVDNKKVVMLELIHEDEAYEILELFKYPGIKWNDNANLRFHIYSEVVNTGDRKDIAKVVNTLLRGKMEAALHDRKLHERDLKLLQTTKDTLFKELSISLDTSFEEINEIVIKVIRENKIS